MSLNKYLFVCINANLYTYMIFDINNYINKEYEYKYTYNYKRVNL